MEQWLKEKYIIDLTATDSGGKSTITQFVIYVDDGNPSTISAVTPIPNQTHGMVQENILLKYHQMHLHLMM